jgi:hypothetical protein
MAFARAPRPHVPNGHRRDTRHRVAAAAFALSALASTAAVLVAPGADAQSRRPSVPAVQAALHDIACHGALCVTVGWFPPTGGSATTTSLAETVLGKTITSLKPPSPGANATRFYGVACPTTTECYIVGAAAKTASSASYPIAYRWTNHTWTSMPLAAPSGTSGLNSVSCTSATACVAVGYAQTKASTDSAPLAYRLTGSSWSQLETSRFGVRDELDSVSCVSSTACTAVGYAYYATYSFDYVLQLAGSTWTVQTAPNPYTGSYLQGVTCWAPGACYAVGQSNGGAIILALQKGTWKLQKSSGLSARAGPALSAVACLSATNCTAVGYENATTPGLSTLAVQLRSGIWTRIASIRPGTTSSFNAIACLVLTCTAVGYDFDGSGNQFPVIESLK